MKQKPAMALLIDDLKENNRHHYEANIEWFNKLLAIERQQIEEALVYGFMNGENKKDYFNQNLNQD
jgi:hypothetical protein